MFPMSAGLRALFALAGIVLLVAALYFARSVLVPVALALLLTFLMSPLVDRLQRLRLGHTLPVVIVLLASLGAVSGIGWLVMRQVAVIAEHAPEQKQKILAKIEQLRAGSQGSFIGRILHEVEDLKTEVAAGKASDGSHGSTDAAPVAVKLESHSLLDATPVLLEVLAHAGFVVLLASFMLLNRRELRDRLIRLLGARDLPRMTKALDETADRISQYLGAQCIMNGLNGLVVGIGLAIMGIPYAILFGFATALLRFVPYLGIWIAAALAVLTSVATFEGWREPMLVMALFAGTDIATYTLIEPFVYSRKLGISAVALLIAVAAWTAIWGPVGLLLAAPLTVCLAVAARHVPQLELIDILIGAEPVMSPATRFYQRLLARDPDEAMQIVEEYLSKAENPADVHDAIVCPSLNYIRRDRLRTDIHDDDVAYILSSIDRVLELLDLRLAARTEENKTAPVAPSAPTQIGDDPCVLAYPAGDAIDSMALGMLQHLMPGTKLELVSDHVLLSELITKIETTNAPLIVIASCPPGGLTQCRYVVKRLRARFPSIRIVLGRFGGAEEATPAEAVLREEGADVIATTLIDGRQKIFDFIGLSPAPPTPKKEPGRLDSTPESENAAAVREPSSGFLGAAL